MRILALTVFAIFCFLSLGCEVILQPSQQGEWSDFQSDKNKISKDSRPKPEQKPAEK